MSIWQNIKAEDLDLDGDEINIHYDDDSSGAWYLIVKVKDIKDLLSVRDERSEESAVDNKWENGGWRYKCSDGYHDGFWKTVVESPQWLAWQEQAYEEGFDYDEVSECGCISQKHFQSFIEFTIQAERTRIIKALEGLEEINNSDPEAKTFNHAINQAIKAIKE